MKMLIVGIVALLTIPAFSVFAESPEPVVPDGYILVPAEYPELAYREGIRMACMYRQTRYWLSEGAGELAPEIAAKKCVNYARKVYGMYGEFNLDMPEVVPTPQTTWGRGYWRDR